MEKKNKTIKWIFATAKGLIFVLFALVALLIWASWEYRGFFADPELAKQALTIQGFHSIEINAQKFILLKYQGCSEDDVVKFEATAINPANKKVRLTVCSGWPFKGETIRGGP